MGLKGDLSATGLFEIFQMISMSQKEGTLVVQDATSRKSIHFTARGVRMLSTGERRGLRLGDILVRHGLINEGQLAEVLQAAQFRGKKLGEVLVENGYVDEGLVQQVVREQIEEEIYDLFLWKKAQFEFQEGPPAAVPADAAATQLTFDVNGLLLEAIRRADQWDVINKKIPSLDGVYAFASDDARAEEDHTALEWLRRAYRLLDGQRTVAELIEDSGAPKFEICKALVDLLDRGRIRPLDVNELMRRADQILSTNGHDRGLRLYRAAAAQAAEDTKVLGGMAGVLEAHGLSQEAASCLVRAGRILMTRVNFVRALECMERAARIRPQDTEPLTGILDVYIGDQRLDKAKDFVREHAPQSLRDGDPLRARALCDRVVAADPADLEFRVLRARAFHQANQPKALSEELRYIHEHLPEDPAAAEKLKSQLPETRSITRLPTKGRSTRGRNRKIALGAAIVLLALAGVAGKYEMDAVAEVDRVLAAARADADPAEARRRVEAFQRGRHRYAFTPRAKAAAFLAEIQARERAEAADQTSREAGLRETGARRFTEELESVRDEFPRSPARALERARALAGTAEVGDRSRRARELVDDLERLLDEARRLRESAEALIREGQHARAAEAVDRLLARFPNTDAARDARYPLAISSRPRGVRVTNARTGELVGVTSDTPLLLLLTPADPMRLLFEKPGYASPPPRDIVRKNAGTLRVEMTEKLAEGTWPAGRPLAGDPVVLGDLALVAAANILYAVKAGPRPEPAWTHTLDSAVLGSPLAANGLVYVTTEKALYAIDPAKPAEERPRRYELGERASGPPALSPDGATLFVGAGDRTLRAVDARSLEGVWSLPLPGEARGEPACAGNVLLVACDNGALVAVDLSTRREAWRVRNPSPFGPLRLSGSTLYVSSPDPFLYAVDAPSGRPIWPRRALPAKSTGRPLHAEGLLFTGGMDGLLHRTDAQSGKAAGAFPSGAAIRGGAAMAGPLILFGNDEGVLHALDAGTYETMWTLRCQGPLRGTPVVAGNRAYLSCGDTLVVVALD